MFAFREIRQQINCCWDFQTFSTCGSGLRINSSSIRKAPIKRVYEDYLASYAHIQKGTAADMRCLKSLPGLQTLEQTSRDIFVKDKCSSACSSPLQAGGGGGANDATLDGGAGFMI